MQKEESRKNKNKMSGDGEWGYVCGGDKTRGKKKKRKRNRNVWMRGKKGIIIKRIKITIKC